MSIFKEKLNKNLFNTVLEFNIEEPKIIQEKLLARINGGNDVVGIAPDNSGKTTLIALAIINKLQNAFEDAPRALVLMPDTDKVILAEDQFNLLAKNTNLRICVAHEKGRINKQAGIDEQGESIYAGCDIIIATPKRAFDLYLKQHINLNKLIFFVLDDAELMIKNEFQGQIDRMIHSLPKCQHLVFATSYNEKIEKLISKFIINPAIVEIEA